MVVFVSKMRQIHDDDHVISGAPLMPTMISDDIFGLILMKCIQSRTCQTSRRAEPVQPQLNQIPIHPYQADELFGLMPVERHGILKPPVFEKFLPLNYLRPYLAGGVVACTLFCGETWLAKAMHNRVLGYLAAVSYALYVLHPFVADTWLGDGDKLEKYLKRPLYFAVLFALAHLSTRHFERRCIDAGRALESRWLRVAKT